MDFLEFEESRIVAFINGATRKNGGLNVKDVKRILSANSLLKSCRREECVASLQKHFRKSQMYYKQELMDEGYGNFIRLTATEKNEQVGVLMGYYAKASNVLHILMLEVDDIHRNKGIASKLLSYAINDAEENNARTIYLDDASDFGPLKCRPPPECHKKNIYIKHGFKYMDGPIMTYKGAPLDFQMREPTATHMRRINVAEQERVVLD
jgi:GNAT superfamily N-acetyltransferase